MFLISAFAVLALAGADAAPAAQPGNQPASVAKAKPRKICTVTEVTGQRLPAKRCVTVKEEPSSAPAAATAEAAKPEAEHKHHH
ncbi:hypothetical protein [Phenylobacterium sp.]|jgi:hypothetical protein|uniref:hypothetical protein n=1 Tax=Phenylobacterium sp. TaxID=1871053 RepID=UPI002F94C44F